jgi:hypothetical protein
MKKVQGDWKALQTAIAKGFYRATVGNFKVPAAASIIRHPSPDNINVLERWSEGNDMCAASFCRLKYG